LVYDYTNQPDNRIKPGHTMKGLHVDSVIKSFGNKQILTDIFLSCSKGEIIGILGRNGTGKSTLLKIIFGSLQADNRFVRLNGKLAHSLFANRNFISYLPQENFLPNHIQIKDCISILCNKSNGDLLRDYYLIKPMLNKKCKQLSGGEKRLVEIFLIIYSRAEYVLIDEPFKGIAPIYIEDIKNRIVEQSENKGFLITDHDYRNILEIATKTLLLFDGGIKEIKTKSELKDWGYLTE
jgi:ABC-type lipopolysaccharide export system ATPase subunit